MRTTIDIDDELYRTVREHAARSGRTVSAVVEDAVRWAMQRQTPAGPPRPLSTFRGSGLRAGIDLTSNSALRDEMDGDPLGA
jgi:Arc/MetJ family transcription regulator